VELLFHQKGESASFGTKIALSLNGVDPGCMMINYFQNELSFFIDFKFDFFYIDNFKKFLKCLNATRIFSLNNLNHQSDVKKLEYVLGLKKVRLKKRIPK
jgi:hypothetical protein